MLLLAPSRPLGQMILGTVVNGVIPLIPLFVFIFLAATRGSTLSTGEGATRLEGLLWITQWGTVAIIGWWRWFGRRRPSALVDDLAVVLKQDRAAVDAKIGAAKEEVAGWIERARDSLVDALAEQQRAVNAVNERCDELETRREQDEIRHLNELRKAQRGEPLS